MGNSLPVRAGVPAGEIDSDTARDDGSNATSHAGSPAVEVKIHRAQSPEMQQRSAAQAAGQS
jgi:hypothetical protein